MLFLIYNVTRILRGCKKGGFNVKVVFASTPDQEEKILELTQYFYSNVFPDYFTDKDIVEFERMNVLHISQTQFEEFSTLGEAFHVIASLQTLISILEYSNLEEEKYQAVFKKNVNKLEEYGISFPFDYKQFLDAKEIKTEHLSTYTKAANHILI